MAKQGGGRPDLLYLWHVPVLGDTIAVDALCNFCVQQVLLGTPASATHT